MKQASRYEGDKLHGLMLLKRIEKGNATWYILSESEFNACQLQCVTHLSERKEWFIRRYEALKLLSPFAVDACKNLINEFNSGI